MRIYFRCVSAPCDFQANHFLVKIATLNFVSTPLAIKLILKKNVLCRSYDEHGHYMRIYFRCLSAICDFQANHFLVKIVTLNFVSTPLAIKLIVQKFVFFVGCMMNMCTICTYILDACRRYVLFKRAIFWSK